MTKAGFVLESGDWRVYEVDDSTPVANENTKGGVDYNEPIVVHLQITETGGAGCADADYDAQYSFNQSDWFTPGIQGGSAVVNYDNNPNLTEHAASSVKLADTPTAEKVHETDCADIDIVASTSHEISMCFELNDTVGERDIYIRCLIASTAVPLASGATYPVVTSGVAPEPEGEADKRAILRGVGKGIMRGVG